MNVKKAIERYMWNGKYFIKNIRLRESSSVVSDIDASAIALADFNVISGEKMEKTVKAIEKQLTHRLGGICRYKKQIGRNNGGWGPWPHFTLMLARYYIRMGNKRKADLYLDWIEQDLYDSIKNDAKYEIKTEAQDSIETTIEDGSYKYIIPQVNE